MTWSKWDGIKPIDADDFLRRAEAEDAPEVVRAAEHVLKWDERGVCHLCGHWRVTYCNADGFHYCDTHYPEAGR